MSAKLILLFQFDTNGSSSHLIDVIGPTDVVQQWQDTPDDFMDWLRETDWTLQLALPPIQNDRLAMIWRKKT